MIRLGIGLGQESSEKAAIESVVCSNPAYTSDFSAGVDGWTGDTGVSAIIGNRDAIGGLNDNVGVRFAVGIPIITKTLAEEVSSGCTYTYSLRLFIPTGNKDVTYISKLLIGGEEIPISGRAIATNTWTLFTGTFTASQTLTSFGIEFNAGSTSSELVYLREISLTL
jgi:hypothetical protein